MKVTAMLTSSPQYLRGHSNSKSTDSRFINALQEKSKDPQTSSEKSRILGRFVFVSTGFKSAKVISIAYTKDSTPEVPIMCDSDGNNRISINDINPENASELEIQMLCAHLDATGRGTKSKFGTYSDLKTARMAQIIAKTDSLSNVVPNYYQRVHELNNWTEIIDDYMKEVKNNDPKQYASMKHISRIFHLINHQDNHVTY